MVWVLISLAAAVLLWVFASMAWPMVFAGPVKVFEAFLDKAGDGSLWEHTWASLSRVLTGFAIAFVTSIPVAFLMAWYDPFRHVVEPWIQFIRNIPPLAYVFLIVAALGIGSTSKITVIFIAAFLVMVVTIFQGVKGVDTTLIKAARVLGAKQKDIFFKITIPATTPFILVAARLGLSTSLTTLMASEIVGGDKGLGMMMLGAAACDAAPASTSQADPQSAAGSQTEESQAEESQAEESQAETPSYEPATVRVAYMPNLGSAGSLFIGIEQGYFEEVGLTVETFEFQGGPAEITAMASGDIDIAQIGHGAHALCAEGQAVIFQMDHTTSLSDVVVGNRSRGIETAADLKGKTVAVSSGTSSEVILQQALKKAGLTMDDINRVEMNVEGMTTAMIGNQIDACAAWSPNTITLQDALGENYVDLGHNAEFLDSAIFPSSFISTTAYAEKNRDILVRFAQALNKAHDYRLAHQEEMAKLLADKLDAPEDTMIRALGEADWETITKVCGDMDEIKKLYEIQQTIFVDSGRLPEAVPVEDYVLFDVMQEAYDGYAAAK